MLAAALHLIAPQPRPVACLNIGIIGTGQVGGALLDQLKRARPRLREQLHLDVQVVAVANSRRMWLHQDDVELNQRRGAQCWRPVHLDELARYVQLEGHGVLVDCSASDAVADQYARWLQAGIHVLTANKRAGAGPLARWQAITQASQHHHRCFRYEATVGAGLPVIQTLRDLLDTGDTLHEVTGMLSGSLAWLFNRYDGTMPFSELVREARALGYTEPDPRDDLSGMDVARKLVILAREAGQHLDLADVAVQSLVPDHLTALPLDAFLARLDELDAHLAHRLAAAHREDGVLRHVAHLDAHGQASVRVQAVPSPHAFAHTRLTDNIVQFTTERYATNPLVIQGPGAGPAVTAAGIFTDLLRLIRT